MIEAVSQKDLDEVVKLRVKLFKESGKIKSKTEENEMIHYNKKYLFSNNLQGNKLLCCSLPLCSMRRRDTICMLIIWESL